MLSNTSLRGSAQEMLKATPKGTQTHSRQGARRSVRCCFTSGMCRWIVRALLIAAHSPPRPSTAVVNKKACQFHENDLAEVVIVCEVTRTPRMIETSRVPGLQQPQSSPPTPRLFCGSQPEGASVMMGGLHPRSSLFERPLNLAQARKQHENFREVMRTMGVKVLTVRDILR